MDGTEGGGVAGWWDGEAERGQRDDGLKTQGGTKNRRKGQQSSTDTRGVKVLGVRSHTVKRSEDHKVECRMIRLDSHGSYSFTGRFRYESICETNGYRDKGIM